MLAHIRGLILVAPWLLYILAADILLSLLLPLKFLFPVGVYDLSSHIASVAWRWVQYLFEAQNGAVITISGDVLPEGESAVVVANHVAWCDFYMLQKLAIGSGMLGRCRWFAKRQLRAVPFLGWGLWALGMPLVSRNWLRDKTELEQIFSGITEWKWPTWLISYSEATRITPKKYLESQKFCEATSRPQPQHLLYPRTKGFVATVQHLRKASHVKAVYDVTIAYQTDMQWQQAPSFWETLSTPALSLSRQKGGRGHRFHVHARRFLIEEMPQDNEELAKWLEQRWVEKGQWLEEKRLEWL
ncbi:1-acyl-sn-glycerol-3-phosphate acyltransferase [Schizothecium vesticola]|uniref:1-acyl-sn-glycerol-3-phosphate acyltransferase n=1 Tax=Schizothecium vesticola TaxID=314040 RepID=A0AA40F5J9_9PEZI|nr:1-acyl-sn-glycerol-3-phosphate acyltransferase [Schizothecium vesticola]